jgi:hypothetical protein
MQAALHSPDPINLPTGGLATFLTAETGSWADEDDYPTTGIGSVRDVADKLAEFGRWEDTYIVHAAEGETVVPMAILDGNPGLKESLFNQMREMGLDPEQYVVGNELNSLNPVTGQPEFSFFSRTWKKLKKAAKKAFKVVIPIIVQAVLTPILGPMGASAATSFLQAKYYGADTKDAFKSAGIAALTTGVLKGVQGSVEAGAGNRIAGFKKGVGAGLTGSETWGSTQDQKPSKLAELLGAKDTSVPSVTDIDAGTAAAMANETGAGVPAGQGTVTPVGEQASGAQTFAAPEGRGVGSAPIPETSSVGSLAQQNARDRALLTNRVSDLTGKTVDVPGLDSDQLSATQMRANLQQSTFDPATLKPASVGERFTNIFTDQGGGTFKEVLGDVKDLIIAPSASETDIMMGELDLAKYPNLENMSPTEIKKLYMKNMGLTSGEYVSGMKDKLALTQGGLIDRYAVPAGLGYAALAASTPEEEDGGPPEWFDTRSSVDVFRSNPAKYGYGYGTYGPYQAPGMADGGRAFPRRNGGISGPGTGTSDDIPAMLSDGEFVMTAQAVQGAGNGSRKQGMRRMYDMMRNFEGTA